MKKLTFLLTCFLASPVLAEFTYDVDVTSNYIHRGVSMSDDSYAISGSVTYREGQYYGTGWVSTLSDEGSYGEVEVNVQAGMTASARGLDYDLGIKHAAYPNAEEGQLVDYTEVYGKVAEGNYSLGGAYTFNADDKTKEGDVYYHGSYKHPINEEITGIIRIGHYEPNDEKTNMSYDHADVIINRGDFSIQYSHYKPKEGKEENATGVSWHHSF